MLRRTALLAGAMVSLSGAIALTGCGGGSGERTPATSAAATPSAAAAVSPRTLAPIPKCDTHDVELTLVARPGEAGSIVISVEGSAPAPCTLATALTPRLSNADGILSPVEGASQSRTVEVQLPATVGSFTWLNECRFDGPFRISVTLGTALGRTLIATPPQCIDRGIVASLAFAPAGERIEPAATATAIVEQMQACDLSLLELEAELRYVEEWVEVAVNAVAPRPCRLNGLAGASIVDSAGIPLGVEYSGIQEAVDVLLPAAAPVVGFAWTNRCGAGDAAFRLAIDGLDLLDVPVEPLACQSDARNMLTKLGAGGPGRANRTPIPVPAVLPAGLAAFDFRSAEPVQRVAVYGDLPAFATCDDLHLNLVPADRRGDVDESVVECRLGAERLHFLQDSQTGVLYLHRVNILLRALLGLPGGGGECTGMAEWMIPAEEDPDEVAEWITTCDARPTLAGDEPPGGRLIWANVLTGSVLAGVPPETPCWQLGAHLGPARGATSESVVCTFYP
jgi:hypothetical protein